ncbi:hypothetical protein LG204_08320 [Methylovorus menthalis]|uniref:hypothetical protein n=1 Tax=Methylovorus menthalis TaxID=1002227 RepID=UPI001E5E9DF6|nr:hypothetical protein [Methylovorus menthalis]MCB4811319.1 hypothetical protein [Methylovorus menthalis]
MKKNLPMWLLIAALMPSFVYASALDATEDGYIGLIPAGNYRLTKGRCDECHASPQSLWYFKDEIIGTTAYRPSDDTVSLVWLGSSKVFTNARILNEDTIALSNGETLAFGIVPKIKTNLSYFNQASLDYLMDHPVRLRGEVMDDNGMPRFVARTIWPLNFKILSSPPKPLAQGESLQQLVRSNNGGAQRPFQTRVLWQRPPSPDSAWQGKAVIGLMLNGAQGDDDEAHGGHFGILTGQYQSDGDWSRWLVNNFYNLDSYSEKGIIAAPTPADKYLMDLNNGQSYYRPSYMLVAIMRDSSIPQLYQSSINKVFEDFYRHNITYDHAKSNCAGISIDALRQIGWKVPERGSDGYLKAVAAYLYVAITSKSLKDARNVYNYITEESTRLNPAAAFDAIGNDMLMLANQHAERSLTLIERRFSESIEALVYVQIPQIPSSRAFGQAPVYSFDEYLERAPADRSQWKIVPVEPRPFPDNLKGKAALELAKPSIVPVPVAIALLLMLSSIVAGGWWISRKL